MTVANLVNNLGTTQAFMGRHADAERSFRAAFETHRALLGEHHWRTVNVARNVGRVLAMQQRYAEALPWMDRAVTASAGPDASKSAGRWGMLAQRAQVLFRLGRREEALSETAAAVESLERLPANDRGWPLGLARVLLGRMLIETGRPREAEAPWSLRSRSSSPWAETHPQRAEASCELGRARVLQGTAPRAGSDWSSACPSTGRGASPNAKSWPRSTGSWRRGPRVRAEQPAIDGHLEPDDRHARIAWIQSEPTDRRRPFQSRVDSGLESPPAPAVNNPHLRVAGEKRGVQERVEGVEAFVDRHAVQIDRRRSLAAGPAIPDGCVSATEGFATRGVRTGLAGAS